LQYKCCSIRGSDFKMGGGGVEGCEGVGVWECGWVSAMHPDAALIETTMQAEQISTAFT
jgi:hypothetical protein